MKFPALVFSVLLSLAAAAFSGDGETGFVSPDKKLLVTRAEKDGFETYAIKHAVTGRTLVVCPEGGRSEPAPSKVVWSADSRLVAIHSRWERHAGAADFWFITAGKARWFTATFPDEKGDFYFTPKRWLNATDLEFDVIGKFWNRADSPVLGKLFKSYRLVMRVNRKTGTVKVFKITGVEYFNPT